MPLPVSFLRTSTPLTASTTAMGIVTPRSTMPTIPLPRTRTMSPRERAMKLNQEIIHHLIRTLMRVPMLPPTQLRHTTRPVTTVTTPPTITEQPLTPPTASQLIRRRLTRVGTRRTPTPETVAPTHHIATGPARLEMTTIRMSTIRDRVCRR